MTNKKRSLNIFATIRDIIRGYFEHWADLAELAKLETKLAIKTVVKISIVIYLLGFLLTTTWMIVLVIIFFSLISLHFSFLSSAFILLLINLILIISLLFYILHAKKYLFFQATRKQLTYQKEINS